ELASVYDTMIRGVQVRAYVPEGVKIDSSNAVLPAFIYFHGGGWVLGDLETKDPTVRDIADAAGMICISVHYRRAPEHPFPAALDDCVAVVDGVLSGETGLGIDAALAASGGGGAGGESGEVVCLERRGGVV